MCLDFFSKYFEKNMQKTAYLFEEEPASKKSVLFTKQLLQKFWKVVLIKNKDIERVKLSKEDIFIFPGGNSARYGESVSPENQLLIKRFVKDGGFIMGICAGAYYLAKSFNWHSGSWVEKSTNNLQIAQVEAEGPLQNLPFTDVPGEGTLCLRIIDEESKEKIWVYYYAGNWFNLVPSSNAKIVARYQVNGLPAIIKGSYGAGSYWLSGPHIEWDISDTYE